MQTAQGNSLFECYKCNAIFETHGLIIPEMRQS